MIEKKTATIAVLCVATILFMGLWSNSAQEARTLNSKYVKAVEDYDRLNSDYLKLEAEKASLEENCSKLKTEKANLEWNYLHLYISEEVLKSDYDALKKEYDEAKTVAKSAEWVSEDGRLKVTSELIPAFLHGTLYHYDIRVNITNIGNKPIDKVEIFLFPYVDGKFVETYIYGSYHTCTVENLYIGETYSHDFTSISEDMTSYKVLAVAG